MKKLFVGVCLFSLIAVGCSDSDEKERKLIATVTKSEMDAAIGEFYEDYYFEKNGYHIYLSREMKSGMDMKGRISFCTICPQDGEKIYVRSFMAGDYPMAIYCPRCKGKWDHRGESGAPLNDNAKGTYITMYHAEYDSDKEIYSIWEK